MIVWLMGLSASGKTTLGKMLSSRLSLCAEPWVFLDGDTFRHIIGEDLGHSMEERIKNAYRISRMCQFLDSQEINVLACVLSVSHENQRFNRETFRNYKEVFLDVPFEILKDRDNKGLYQAAIDGSIENVVGVDIEFTPPYSPDLVLDNSGSESCLYSLVDKVLDAFNIEVPNLYEYTQENRLKKPHKYQYSKFFGKPFLNSYKKDRQDKIDLLTRRLDSTVSIGKGEKNSPLSLFSHSTEFALKKIRENIDTSRIPPGHFPIALILIDFILSDHNFPMITKFAAKFEITKKIYNSYDKKSLKRSSKDCFRFQNYILFTLAMLKAHELNRENSKRLIFLNAALKSNDIISSIAQDIFDPQEVFLAILAFSIELELIEGIKGSNNNA